LIDAVEVDDHEPAQGPVGALAILDSRRVSRSIARQLSAAACLTLIWLLVAGTSESAPVAALAFGATALAFVFWQRLAPTREARLLIEAGLLGGATLVISTSAIVGVGHSPFLLFFVWLVPWAFIVWSKRRAAVYVAVLAVACAGVMAIEGGASTDTLVRTVLPTLVVGMGGLVAIGVVVRMLVDHLAEMHAAARRTARSQGLVADLARHALVEMAADDALSQEAGRVLSDALEANGTVVSGDAAAQLTAGSAALVLPIGPPAASARQLVVRRAGRPFGDDEIAVAKAVADVLAVAEHREAAERERRDRAGHDELTGLPGRERFADRLAEVLRPGTGGSGASVLVIDIDDFVLVNETLGPLAGDALLRGVADRLRRVADAETTLARFGGDEFALLDGSGGREVQAVDLAKRVQAALKAPFELGEARHHVSASIGIAACCTGRDPREAIRDAHLAQRRAREQGRGRYEVFNSRLRLGLEHRRTVEAELRRALEQREFRLVYQPVVELGSGRVIGAEALLRWQHPVRGLIAPGEFIEVAEASDLIVPIGGWVLRQAMRQLRAWQEGGLTLEGFRLGVNLSGRQLADDSFVPMLRAQLAKYRLDPRLLTCELTETALTDETPQIEAAVREVKALGVALALDDFGSGYASLRYVRRFDFDALKLDRSFVAGLGESKDDTAIIAAAISMGTALNMAVVAEGVETDEQSARLQAMGCRLAQGFLFARPMDASALRALIAGQDAAASSRSGASDLPEPAARHEHGYTSAGPLLALEQEAAAERVDPFPR
jgi:diguanylate cyclase (GGDEF)-like protein